MLREIDLKEISDGKLYGSNDMVRADCFGCTGCSRCCRGMGESIVLDPLDVSRLRNCLGLSFDELLQKHLELHVADGLILPNLRMDGPGEACTFLDGEGRCRIHRDRPGICRIFPLGRYYEDRSFRYFLQVKECPRNNRGKIKVRKWIDVPDVKQYEAFVAEWHFFLRDLQEMLEGESEVRRKTCCMYVLKHFYTELFPAGEDFYSAFARRKEQAAEVLGLSRR